MDSTARSIFRIRVRRSAPSRRQAARTADQRQAPSAIHLHPPATWCPPCGKEAEDVPVNTAEVRSGRSDRFTSGSGANRQELHARGTKGHNSGGIAMAFELLNREATTLVRHPAGRHQSHHYDREAFASLL